LIDKTTRNFRQIGPEEFLPDGIAEELLPLIDTPESQTADKVSLFYLTPSVGHVIPFSPFLTFC